MTLPEDIHPLVLHDLLNKLFNNNWLLWLPETIYKELESLNYTLNRIVKDKIMSLKIIYKLDHFWEHYNVFEKICVAFNHRVVFFNQFQELTPEEVYFAHSIASKLRPDLKYSSEVLEYIKNIFKNNGQIYSPEDLNIFNNYENIKSIKNKLKLDKIPDKLSPIEIQAIGLIRLEKYKEIQDNKGKIQMKELDL